MALKSTSESCLHFGCRPCLVSGRFLSNRIKTANKNLMFKVFIVCFPPVSTIHFSKNRMVGSCDPLTLRLPKLQGASGFMDAKRLMNIAHFPIPVDGTIKAIRRLTGVWAFGSHTPHVQRKQKRLEKNRWHYIELTIIGKWSGKCQIFLLVHVIKVFLSVRGTGRTHLFAFWSPPTNAWHNGQKGTKRW